MSLCDYPNFCLSQFGVMTSYLSTKIVPDLNFLFLATAQTILTQPRKLKLDFTPTQIGKTESKMSHLKSGLAYQDRKMVWIISFLSKSLTVHYDQFLY